jgi:hypothetical protein
MFDYSIFKQAPKLPPVPNTAIITGIYYGGMTLLFPGDTQPSQKHYRGLAGVAYTVGQTVQITKVSGTYLVGLPLGVLDSRAFLYRDGNECTPLTGGWVNDYYLSSGCTRINATKESSCLRVYYASSSALNQAAFGPANAIDLTNYTKLTVNADIITPPARLYLQYGSSKTGSTWTSLISETTPSVGSHTYEVDVSALNSSYYLRHVFMNVSGTTSGCDANINTEWNE